ncbi:MarR family winged helix-turn-helix transcriptional regulator [Luteibacter yeojuensis]|uniref:MarR family transcriptional regulator n=1 Tax=Luteibacter yeojuensis TaxID=345309 RepID=A0A7X5QXH6_9GAMM|nr:MarR family transcriptional regulator [Luteibacter yeojuensis]NID17214.1 MarR family transcriptional regulator [Luteibacter yeojuensis]
MGSEETTSSALGLGRDLMLAGSRLRDAVGRRAQREFGLTALQSDMLLLLALRGSMISTELAMACGVNASTVTHAVDAGIERGLMVRERNAEDRRLVDIALTLAGKRMAERVRALVADLARTALEGVDQPAVLAESLAQVTRNLEKGQAP